MSTRHNTQSSIESYSDQYIIRRDKPDEPLDCGPGSSVHPASVDVSSGTELWAYDTTAATIIGFRSPGFDQHVWERRNSWHEGNNRNWNDYKQENHEDPDDKLHRIDIENAARCLCSSANLINAETEIVVHHAKRFDYRSLGYHRSIYRGILGIIAVVVEVRRVQHGADFYAASMHCDEAFKSLMAEVGIDYNDLKLIKRIVRRQMNESHGSMAA
ncbi:hypothetical protein [Haloferax volcanii]|uniref:hypothetical protein n=1 Tax=Haloferax volcanii TaxID=2246 RepID=UPI0038527D93